jgi:hypothetical protein
MRSRHRGYENLNDIRSFSRDPMFELDGVNSATRFEDVSGKQRGRMAAGDQFCMGSYPNGGTT